MSSINNISSSNNDGYTPKLTQEQQKLFSYFKSIFNIYDKNGDGKIDDKDSLTATEKVFVKDMKKILSNYGCELSMESFNDLLTEGSLGTRDALNAAEDVKFAFQQHDKDGNGVINEKDKLTQTEKYHTKNEKFNGVDAQVTYDNDGKIMAVRTNAKNEREAASKMGLARPAYWERYVDEQSGAVRYRYHGEKELPGRIGKGDWFEWDAIAQIMLREGKDIE